MFQKLMSVSQPNWNLEWLQSCLQTALKLEFSTLPPYLCALWSIKDPSDSNLAYDSIKEHIAEEEMLHMGLVCNLLVAIGAKPDLTSSKALPTYPGPLPGGVQPDVEVSLRRFSREALQVFLKIEYPEAGPIEIENDRNETQTFAESVRIRAKTIGNFYTMIQEGFTYLSSMGKLPELKTEKQLERAFDPSEGPGIFIIRNLEDVERAIQLIKRQGEGSSGSPIDTGIEDLAHYYRFLELYRGRKITQDTITKKFKFSDDPEDAISFPEVWPMAEIPAGGYTREEVEDEQVWQKIEEFDRQYSLMLRQIETAWDGNPEQLRTFVGTMSSLTPIATDLMAQEIPSQPGQTYGPCFRLTSTQGLPGNGGSGGGGMTVDSPTWEDDIKGLFNDGDVACMKRRGLDLSSYQDVKVNAQNILDAVSSGFMPPGNPWSQSQIDTFKRWIELGTPEGGAPAMGERPGWNPTSAPEAGSRYDDIWFVSPQKGWAVNSDGQILHTNDGGATWVQQFRTPMIGTRAVYLRCISFANDQKGWVGTLTDAYRMFQTIDGGTTWTFVANLPDNAPLAICGLYVVNEMVVYASGTNFPYKRFPTRVLKTTDGGETWTAINMEAYASNLIDIFFFNEQEGFVVGGFSQKDDPLYDDVVPVVLYTTDGGQTWENRVANLNFEPGEWGWKIYFVNNLVGYVSLESFTRGAVLKTTDGGQTWSRLPINDQQGNANLEGIGFITEDRGWVGGWGNADFTAGYTSGTIDGGQNWTDANEVGRFINRFRFIGDPVTVGYASGRMIYKYNPEGVPEVSAPQLAGAGSILTGRMIKTAGLQRFTNTAIISVQIPEGAKHAWLNIWNRFGLEVRLLLDESNPTVGERQLFWDGLDDDNSPVASGVYIFRLTVDDSSDSGSFYLHRDL
ncbi:MAG: ferritin-like domain-containing protein [Calothrix sp. MO_192.B10]|nr:ferritin-like domain-containing protein [Calothrix sp. MO_192.B10]